MTPQQQSKLNQLEDELGVTHGTLPIRGEREGYVFTEVNGVTVLLARKSRNPRGGYIVPALHTYTETMTPTNLDAAVHARKIFDNQSSISRKYGHLSPVVDPRNWKCGNENCLCSREPYQRRAERSIGPGRILSETE